MKRTFLVSFVVLGLILLRGLALSQVNPLDGGELAIQVVGGTEIFGVAAFSLQGLPDGSFLLLSSGSLVPPGVPRPLLQFQHLELNSDFRPLRYTLYRKDFTGEEQIIRTTLSGRTATVTIEGGAEPQTKTFTTETEFLLFDTNVASHLVAFLERMRLKDSPFSFDALMPQELTVVPMVATGPVSVRLRTGSNPFTAEEYHIEVPTAGEPVLFLRLFALQGRLIGFLQEQAEGPAVITFRRDLFPAGLEVPGEG